jgi:Gluconate 2-dehydrogenase subunit 3
MALTAHLSPRQIATLAALVDTIVPADGYPSGTDAGVLDHLDRQFAADLAGHLPGYRLGLDSLDAESRAVYGRPFAALRAEQRPRRRTEGPGGAVPPATP